MSALETEWSPEAFAPRLWWERPAVTAPGELLAAGKKSLAALRDRLGDDTPAALLWHYSVFTLSYRGVPILAPLYAATLRRVGIPVVTMLHEFVYPWGTNGIRGAIWSISQRTVLPLVAKVSAGVVVTTEARMAWLSRRRWLPRRAVLLSPVISTLPKSVGRFGAEVPLPSEVALLGFSPAEVDVDLVLRSVAVLRAGGRSVRLRLIGSPGEASPIGEHWKRAAGRAGCAEVLTFTGILSPERLAETLSSAGIILIALRTGPSSRKTTVASALASGRPIVAVDGIDTWERLRATAAVCLVPPSAEAVAGAVGEILDDRKRADVLGQAGRRFHERELDPRAHSDRVLAFVREQTGIARGRCAEGREG